MSAFESMNLTKVTGEMLARANDAVARAHESKSVDEGLGLTGAFLAIRDEFGDEFGKGIISAIVMRLHALSLLINEKAIGRWAIEVDGHEYMLVQEAVFRAAATAKLGFNDDLAFDPAEITRLALELSDEEGHA